MIYYSHKGNQDETNSLILSGISIFILISKSHRYGRFAKAKFEPGGQKDFPRRHNGSFLPRIDIRCPKLPRFRKRQWEVD